MYKAISSGVFALTVSGVIALGGCSTSSSKQADTSLLITESNAQNTRISMISSSQDVAKVEIRVNNASDAILRDWVDGVQLQLKMLLEN